MKIDKAAILARDDATTLKAFFREGSQTYTFLVLKKVAKHLNTGDHVCVQTQNGLQIAQVYKVHEETRIDADAGFKYQWAFQKIHIHRVEELNAQQQLIEEKLRDHQRQSVRSRVLETFGVDNRDIQMITSGGKN